MSSSTGQSILIIEDEPQFRSYLKEILEEEGFAIYDASDAPSAFGQLQRLQALSLVITDIKIPGYVSGTMFAHVVSEYRPEVPILVISGYAEPKRGELPSNAVFLGKPFTSSMLLQTLRDQLQRVPAPTHKQAKNIGK